EPRETFLSQQLRQRIDADRVAGTGQVSLDVVDREILLAHGRGQCPDAVMARWARYYAKKELEQPKDGNLKV
ncbi:MAG: hypothetical protein HY650_11615, partial [Acidobacteria bacterium]|nr:hypothetical protein [Acidobacteriota bacterium]